MCAVKDPTSLESGCTIIPENRWKKDPLFSCCCNLFIKDILDLQPYPSGSQEGQDIYCTVYILYYAKNILQQLNHCLHIQMVGVSVKLFVKFEEDQNDDMDIFLLFQWALNTKMVYNSTPTVTKF